MADIHTQKIAFDNGNEALAVSALAGTPAGELVAALSLPAPKLVILVIGGAGSLDGVVKNRLSALYRHLAKKAAAWDAIVIDGGTQAGIMAMMGEGMMAQEKKVPLVGVTPIGKATYPGNAVANGAPLEPNHSHFVLVEGDEWGDETPAMFDLVHWFRQGFYQHDNATNGDKSSGAKPIPSVAILAGGGQIAKQEVLRVVRQNIPLLVLSGSGGFADEIAASVKHKRRGESDAILLEVTAYEDLNFHAANDGLRLFNTLLVKLLGIEKVLVQAWETFAVYDSSAKHQQKQFNRQQLIILILGVLGTALVAVQQAFAPRDAQHHLFPQTSISGDNFPWWLIHYVLILLPILITVFTAAINYFKPGRRWLFLRAGAEAVKREIYRYRVRKAAGFHNAEKELAENVDAIARRTMQTEANLSALLLSTNKKSFLLLNKQAMDDDLDLLTPNEYVTCRLAEQMNFYFDKTIGLDKKQKRLYWAILLSGAAGTFLAALNQQVWVALTIALAAALGTYFGYRQIEFLLVKYNQTGTALSGIKTWWDALSADEQGTQENIALLVEHTEQVLQVEQDSWLQQMQNAMAKLKDDQQKASKKTTEKND